MTEIRTPAEAHEASALPRARVVHCNDDAPETPEVLPLPPEQPPLQALQRIAEYDARTVPAAHSIV